MDKMGKMVSLHFFQVFFILAGNEDVHKSLNEFKIGQDLIMGFRVSCP